jgi:hypothetical protein
VERSGRALTARGTALACLLGLAAAGCGAVPEELPPDGGEQQPPPDGGEQPPPDGTPATPPLPAPAAPGTLGPLFAYSALALEPSQGVHAEDVASVAVDRLTLEAWVRWDGDAGRQLIVYSGDPGRNGFGLVVEGGALRVALGGVGDVICGGCRVPAGAWAHVAAVRDGSWSLSVNGAASAVSGAQLAPLAATAGLTMGAAQTSAGALLAGLRGSLDEVRLWEVARTPAQLMEQARITQLGDEAALVAYYRLDEGRGLTVADSSSRRRVAALIADAAQRMPAWIASDASIDLGLSRNALESVPAGGLRAALVATTAVDTVTLEAWVRASGRAQAEAVLYNGDSSRSGYGLLIEGGRLRVLVGGVGFATCDACALTASAWTHVAVVRDAGSWRFYQSGELKQTVPGVTPMMPSGGLWLGVSGSTGTEGLVGSVDEVRIWTRARSNDELRAAARVSLRGDEPGLAHYYRLDETGGATAADAAGALPLTTTSGADARWRRSAVPLAQAVR